jgi:hypothetical protein
MNPADIERLYRLREKLSPEDRDMIEKLHAEMVRTAGGPTSPNPVRSWGPEDLDPVEAAAAPITPDPIAGPVAGPGRNRSRADYATDAATAGGLYSPSENVASMDVTDVPPPAPVGNASAPAGYDEWAAATAEAETGKTKAERLAEIDALERRQDAQKASYDQATGMPSPGGSGLAGTDEAGRDWSNWRPGMPLPPAGGRSMGPGDDSQRGPGYRRVPGPRLPNGLPAEQGDVIYDPEEVARYRTRTWNNERARYNESPEDRDNYKRGRLPVYNPDGSVGYSTGYMPGALESAPGQMNIPGAPGRAGNRPDLEAKGWEKATVDGPTGQQEVYRPGKGAQYRYQEQSDDRARVRLAKQAGISGKDAMGMPLADLRRSAKAAGVDDYNARNAAWKAQSMLAGGQPTGGRGGSKAITNALMMLPEEQRNDSLRYMLPGGQLAAGVDAQNMQNANDVIKRFMTSGAAAGANNPLAQAQAQMAQQQADAAVPVQVRAQAHVEAGRINHPDVLQHADDLVNQHYSSRPGALGVSSRFTDNEVMIGAQRLADDTGMPIAEAEKIMRRIQADRNRNSVASSFIAGFYDQ